MDSPPESARNRDRAEKAVAWSSVVPMADYCGFFSMDDARRARDTLKAAEIRSEIVIRESVGNEPGLDLSLIHI